MQWFGVDAAVVESLSSGESHGQPVGCLEVDIARRMLGQTSGEVGDHLAVDKDDASATRGHRVAPCESHRLGICLQLQEVSRGERPVITVLKVFPDYQR